MHSTNYIIRFVLIMTSVVALALAGLFYATKQKADQNKAVFDKRAVLSAVEVHLDKQLEEMSDEEVLNVFSTQVEQKVLDMGGQEIDDILAEDVDMKKERKKPEPDRMLPLYIYEKGGEAYYIVSVRGNGLWDEIWGFIALEDDYSTIVGAAFDHTGETPGLGAEIKDNPAFSASFKGKKVLNNDGGYVSITVRKGGARDPNHEVDGISGATVTADGVTEMLQRGIRYYSPYFDKLKTQQSG